MRFAGAFGIAVGVLILAQWVFFLATAQVPELESAPFEIISQLTAEFMTATVIITSAIGVLKERPWARRAYLLASGMVIYSVVNNAGYFIQLGEWPLVFMFAVLLLLAVVSISKVVHTAPT